MQQDAAEFTTLYLAAVCGMTSGVAEGRQVQQSHAVCDVHRMLLLQVPSRHESWLLQEILDEWHLQHGPLQALTAPVQHLCLRLDTCNARGVKSTQSIVIGEKLLLPCFASATDASSQNAALDARSLTPPDQHVLWHEYTVRAVVQHHGPSYRAGHYTAILIQDFPKALRLDDACTPQSISDIRQVTHDHYLVWVSLDSTEATSGCANQTAESTENTGMEDVITVRSPSPSPQAMSSTSVTECLGPASPPIMPSRAWPPCIESPPLPDTSVKANDKVLTSLPELCTRGVPRTFAEALLKKSTESETGVDSTEALIDESTSAVIGSLFG